MSAVPNPEDADSSNSPKQSSIEIREGDWKAYLHHSARIPDNKAMLERYGSAHAYKRACAMAYLGRRAQFHGGVCSTTHPHIMTQSFLASLEANNKMQRYGRYPWLETWMNILADIERIQDEISPTSNVISMVSSAK